jgi:hypothetical protein
MSLIDKLRAAAALPDDTDLAVVLGLAPGESCALTAAGVVAGGEWVPLADARLALAGGPVPQTPAGPRAVTIGDL